MTQQIIPDLYKSVAHTCPYLKDKTAANLLVDPKHNVSPTLYDSLIRNGFRRNGVLYYRPQCPNCTECRSVRILVRDFRASRSQKRTEKRNKDIKFEFCPPSYSEEHFTLYRRYQAARHQGDSMDDPDPEKYQQFLIRSNIDTFLVEIRLKRKLLGVSVVDHVANGLSAVYTFYEPDEGWRGLGTLAILHQIELTRQIEYDWLYLGYWIENCEKMNYKVNFTPLQAFDATSGNWKLVN